MKTNKLKRVLLIMITMLVISCGTVAFSTAATVDSTGTCGDDVTWTLDSDGVLTISGSGEMGYEDYYDYDGYDDDELNYYPFDNSFKPYKVKKIIINEGITETTGLSNCFNLVEIAFPSTVVEIHDLSGLQKLETVCIMEGTEEICESAFSGCTSLNTINLPSSINCIGDYAFFGCESISSINIPDGVSTISESSFAGCKSLKSLILPNSVIVIEENAFDECSNLSNVSIPNSVNSIGWDAFSDCTSLTSISIPDSVTEISSGAFSGCSSLKNVKIGTGISDMPWRMFANCTSLKEITIPDNITNIDGSVFAGCSNLTKVVIPDSVVFIDEGAFEYCTSLKTLTIPDSISSIEAYTFSFCENLSTLVLPESVVEIGEDAFLGCPNLSITIPDSVTYISSDAFESYDESDECAANTTILANPDSYAHKYAIEKNIKFRCIEHRKFVEADEVKATCTATGLTAGTVCADCNAAFSGRQIIEKLPHTYGNWVIEYDATCCEEGEKYRECSVCSHTEWEDIPVNDQHNTYTFYGYAATCTEPGMTDGEYCADCKKFIVSQTIIPAKGHNYSKTYTIDKAASTTKNGSKSKHCKNCDAKTDVKTIYKLKTVKLGTTAYTYNGKSKSPKLIIKDSKGNTISSKNYTVTKSKGRTQVGKYTYKITFKNEYKGIKAKTLTFKINPKETTIKTPTASKKAFTVKWSKISKQATGYEIMYATNSKFTKGKKTIKVTSYKTTSKKITGLKSKTKYYVKVRTYKTVNGVKYYSGWSKVKSIKTR